MSLMLEEIAQQPEALARTITEERAKVERLGRHLRALVVGVSQSGEGEDINRVLEMARADGASCTVGITNEPDSSMTKIVDETLLTHGGRERSVAATKTYTGQLLHFYMLAEALAGEGTRLGYEAIPDHAARALELRAEVEQLVERYVF